MTFKGYCCLRINGNDLDFNEIKKHIDLQPTKVCRKGEVINSKYENYLCNEDGWFYELKFDNEKKLDAELNELATLLQKYKVYIQEIYQKHYVRLWCDFYVDNAQLGIELSPDTIYKLYELGIGLDIQMFSSGQIL